MIRSVASSVSLAYQTEHAKSRLLHLLEVRRKLLAERRLQMVRWRALLATSRALLAESTSTPPSMIRTRRLLMQVPARLGDGAAFVTGIAPA